MLKKSKYKDIKEIYNIINIKDGSISIKEGNMCSKILIYEVKPLILLDLSENIKENITIQYKEFLRQINFDFQILITNRKYNYNNYLENIKQYTMKNNNLYENYVLDMEEKIKKESIFETLFYIVVSIKETQSLTVENVDNTLLILDKIGCKVEKILEEEKIYDVLNFSINKGDCRC
jgi:hypothetical protein